MRNISGPASRPPAPRAAPCPRDMLASVEEKIRVVVAGGGTAGWLTAYSLVTRLGNLLEITLVKSDQIGTVGVDEATVATICNFHHIFKVNEREFMRATQATFKLGIVFDN